ncbi:MAG: T9SS type A sorting domain-containing protein [Bacteroidota bacterium]
MKEFSLTFLLIFSCCITTRCYGQFQGKVFDKDTSIAVYAYSQQQAMAWCGGFNNPEFSIADLNQDGINDLVVYERYVGIKTFINTGTAGNPRYAYAPRYEKNFPTVNTIQDTVLYLILLDYNCDNIPDMFIRGMDGFDVSKGYYNASHELCFTHYKSLWYNNDQQSTGLIDAYCNVGDIPAIVDIDHDGDLDFLAYENFGTKIQFYKNMQVELGLPCDSIVIKLADRCWGRVSQTYDRAHILGVPCDNTGLLRPSNGQKITHTGNTCTLIDMDGDGDFDYLDGNISFNDLVMLTNGKSQFGVDSMIAQDTTWPSNGHIVELATWPVVFNIDVDQDGKKDIVVASNASGSSENYNCVWYYKNTGTATVPAFTFKSDTLFVSNSIDIGEGSYPMLYDYDKDGKLDLFVGSDGYYQPGGALTSRISYYKNTSTTGHPAFTLQTNDFLSLSSANVHGASLAVGDIDGDGKDDLVIGHSNGTLSYYKNVAAAPNFTPQWQLAQSTLLNINNANISVGGYAAPFIYDINKDGKPDLIIGCQSGALYYYENMNTTSGQLALKLDTNKLGGIKVVPGNFFAAYSTPFIGKIDNTGIDYLVVGSQPGDIYRFTGFQGGNTLIPYNQIDSTYSYAYPGPRCAPTFADIDGDGMYEMFVGNVLGGVSLYKQQYPVSVNNTTSPYENVDIRVYPSPAKNILNIDWSEALSQFDQHISIFNTTGQKMLSVVVPRSESTTQIHIDALPSGIYFCELQSTAGKFMSRVVVIR